MGQAQQVVINIPHALGRLTDAFQISLTFGIEAVRIFLVGAC